MYVLYAVQGFQFQVKYLINIFNEEEGCKKVKEFVEKDKNNPFFDFINNENYEEMKRNSKQMSMNDFVGKYTDF